MKRFFLIVIIIGIFGIVLFIVSNIEKNNSNLDISKLEFEELNVSNSKMNRYNELINISQVSYLIRNLPLALKNNELNPDQAINYAYIYAYSFEDDYEQVVMVEDNNTYLNYKYIENIIYNIFNKKLDLKGYVTKDDYILVNEEQMTKDAANLVISKIIYNEEMQVYKVTIEEDTINKIDITYKKNNGKNIILECISNI